MDIRYCSFCGKQLKKTHQYCPFCGAQLTKEYTGDSDETAFPQLQNSRQSDNKVFPIAKQKESSFSIQIGNLSLNTKKILAFACGLISLLSIFLLPMFEIGCEYYYTTGVSEKNTEIYTINFFGEGIFGSNSPDFEIKLTSCIFFILILTALITALLFILVNNMKFGFYLSISNLLLFSIYDVVIRTNWAHKIDELEHYFFYYREGYSSFSKIRIGYVFFMLCGVAICVIAFVERNKQNNNTLLEEISLIIRDYIKNPSIVINPNTNLYSDLNLTENDVLFIIRVFEKQNNIRIKDKKIQRIHTVNDLKRAIKIAAII